MDWRNMTIGQALKYVAETWGEREALASKSDRLSFTGLYDRACQLAAGLQKIGIEKGDSVATIFSTNLEWVFVNYALHIIGAWVVPINVSFRAREIEFILKQADVKAIIMMDKLRQGDYTEIIAEIDPHIVKCGREKIETQILPCLKRIVTVSPESKKYSFAYDYNEVLGYGAGYNTKQIDELLAATKPDDICTIMFTSGSTGFPKGAMHTNATLLGIGYNFYPKSFNLNAEHRLCGYFPFFHIAGCVYFTLGALTSACFLYVNEFIPDEIVEIIQKERINLYAGFDAHFAAMTLPQFAGADFSSIKFVMLATGPEWYDRVKKIFPKVEIVATHYGFTEGTGVSTWPDEKDEVVRKFANGRPWPGIEVKIIDPETGKPVVADRPGEICLRGWSRFQGYYKNPEETRKSIDADGYFHSGDYGWLDSRGNLYYRGRYKMMIKTGGENVSERELEMFLEGMPGVKQVQVIGVPDARWGELVVAVIEEDKPESLTEKAVQDFCEGKIAKFKIPKKVVFMRGETWPLLGPGKIDKKILKQNVMQKMGR